MKYSDILSKAKQIKTTVEKEYKLPFSTPVYYICKAILKPKTEIPSVKVEMASKSTGDYISNQIYKTTYLGMAERLCKYVESNGKLPNYITAIIGDKTYKVKVSDYVYMFSRILIYYDTNGKLPSYANVNSKSFTKPTETGNTVYDYFKKVFGDFGDTIDGALTKIAGNGYGYYYDDVYSNKTSIDRMKNGQGVNCTDSCQVFYNITQTLIEKGKYRKVECLHIGCRGGDGHVRLRITLNDGTYIYRDPAAVLSSGSVTYNWCLDGTLWAVNPSWFMQNLHK